MNCGKHCGPGGRPGLCFAHARGRARPAFVLSVRNFSRRSFRPKSIQIFLGNNEFCSTAIEVHRQHRKDVYRELVYIAKAWKTDGNFRFELLLIY
jgi:hypothetical protein